MPTYQIKYVRELISDAPSVIISTPKNAVDYLRQNCFKDEEMWREKVYAVYLGPDKTILGHQLISVGTTDRTTFDHKLIVRGALDCFATGVILSHNHPGGNCRPSQADIAQTKKIKDACSVLDIKLLDHIVIGEKEYFSFNDEVTRSINTNRVRT